MTDYHVGRLIDHVHLRVSDLERSARFYEAVLHALDPAITLQRGDGWVAADEEAVRRFYEVGLTAGGTDNGAPGERSYHPGYYAAYVLDPDGYNVEAVFHGPLLRSAASVVLVPVISL